MILDCLGKAVRRHTRSKLSIKSDTNSGNSPPVFFFYTPLVMLLSISTGTLTANISLCCHLKPSQHVKGEGREPGVPEN